ncbi:SusD/RagB family nutrient-binding outer membrane lipoprotein [Rhizosphaericola mali]|uniref:SusD/RagB family nutrient-binding outer membrane lipoprotein n=1 Tax=Rhizosphaericola mali TaxID=2545455 RepID=A0A5P2G8M2_9BACT|nr:SusD/RagB family nutrient-binding outer membrane lipoprotein [Rhizosphaericola mali]QES89563.1 SusD/RagB family nutrient-binding outer membrane lipoprotein [Rhizosphaericola mali]
MRNLIKYEILILFGICTIILTTSCKKNFEEINTPHTETTEATTPELFNLIISSLPIQSGEYSFMNSWMYPITQQAIVTAGAYPYDNAKAEVWSNFYSTMANYRLLQSRISSTADTTTMDNLSAMLKTIISYKAFKMTNYYGDMPYSNSGYAPLLGSNYYKATYDTQSDIYSAILTDLDWAVDHFSSSSNQYSVGSYETFLKNDVTTWKKFANSLRLYVAVTLASKNSSLATTQISKALNNPLLQEGEDIGLWPSNITNLQFQWRQWSFSANCYLRMGSTMWNWMSSSDDIDGNGIFDIRAKIFYEPNGDDNWVPYPQNPTSSTTSEGGSPYNTLRFTNWDTLRSGMHYSPVNLYFEQDLTSIPELMLTSAQVYFLKAEAYNRGIGVTANSTLAKAAYDSGIAASLNMWKGIAFNSSVWVVNKPTSATATATEIAAITANSKTSYNTSDATSALKQIYAQLWIDQYRQPFDAWTLLKRTGGLTPMSGDNSQYYDNNFGKFYKFLYPDDELSYNSINWKAASGGINLATTKLWIQP